MFFEGGGYKSRAGCHRARTVIKSTNHVPVTTTKGCNATAGEGGVLSIIRLVGDEGGIKGGDTPLKCTPFS